MEGMTFIRNENFLQEIGRAIGKSGHARLLELGDGLLAIQWPDDENFIIYFDTGRWKFTLAIEERYREVVRPPGFINTGVITSYFLRHAMNVPHVVRVIASLVLVPTADHYKLVSQV